MTKRPGIITGLASESACLDQGAGAEPFVCRLSGANAARALAEARALLAEGCDGLVSFGMAGGLDPGLAPGTLILAGEIIEFGGRRFPSDTAWTDALGKALQPAVVGAIAASPTAVCGVADKRRLREKTGALAVDMESGAVAQAASEASVPFIAVRVIADPAGAAVPDWIMGALDERGTPRAGAFAWALARHPLDLFRLIALAFHSRKALTRLGGVAASLRRSLG